MGRKPKPDAHRTGLQRRLSAEVRAGMAVNSRSQADLSRETGIGEPHISLLLRGLRQGTIGAWDKMLRAAHGSVSPIIHLPDEARITDDGRGVIVPPTPPTYREEPSEMGVAFQRAEAERERPRSSLNPRRNA